jgi:hypothetical protein
MLEAQQVSIWCSYTAPAGPQGERGRADQLQTAHLLLLLVSADFLGSRSIQETVIQPAMQRHDRGEAGVIPIILSPVFWQDSPIGKLRPLPENGKPAVD